MKNIITKGNEIIGRHFPVSGDKCVVGQVVAVNGDLVTFKKVWDISDKLFYAVIKYNGRIKDLEDAHRPIVGSYCAFYRVGDFGSQGNTGFELTIENASKSSFLCLVDYKESSEPDIETPIYFSGFDFWRFAGYSTANNTSSEFPQCRTDFTGLFSEYRYYANVFVSYSDSTYYPEEWGFNPTPPGYVQRKSYRTSLNPQGYYLSFYRGYSGNGVFTDLVKRIPLVNTRLPVPRRNAPNKLVYIIEDHPYLPPVNSYYCQVEEILDSNSLVYSGSQSGSSDRLGIDTTIIHRDDKLNIIGDSGTRTDTNFYWLSRSNRLKPFASPDDCYDNVTWQLKNQSRKSGFYQQVAGIDNLPKYSTRQWTLKVKNSTTSTYFGLREDVDLTSTAEGTFNSDAIPVLVSGLGSGGLVPGTDKLAQFYTTDIVSYTFLDSVTPTDAFYPKTALNWRKWDGASWIVASVGDSISNLAAVDSWFGVTRVSNTITLSPAGALV